MDGALKAKKLWETMSFEYRASVFMKAAELASKTYRAELCAATMLGQGKNVWQAEIDAAAETIDFWRFNCKFAQDIYDMQPPANDSGTWNRADYRPLEGFVAAIAPFNFTAIASNLSCAPALMGNVTLWKPAPTAVLSNFLVFKILQQAGLPDGVVQFLPSPVPLFGDFVLAQRDLAGVHFTGSTHTFKLLYRTLAQNLDTYRTFPRLVGETGGKNFHMVHASADVDLVVNSTVRAAFEYQGQKCSACSRLYVPDVLWPTIRDRLVHEIGKISVGPVQDLSVFMSAVIDQASFNKIKAYIEAARADAACSILAGGTYDDRVGYFVQPTLIHTTDPRTVTMREEIFGPVLTVYVYPADQWEDTLRLCDDTTPYALTGALFARDVMAVHEAQRVLRHTAGNLYINDKCTGAVVGQQPFGGSRLSGTNDKSGSLLNLLRWVTPRSTKESWNALTSWSYPSQLI